MNVSSVLNALALLKSIRNKDEPLNWLDSAIAALEAACETASNEQQSKLHFLSEQASLLKKKQNNLRYSLMVSAYSLLSVSTSAYQHLGYMQVLTLPSVNCLGKITRTIDPDVTVINIDYLTKRHSKLMQYQTYVSLSFDEIYIANRLEYKLSCIRPLF